jgi:predicted nucleotidyltransferase
MMLVSDKMATDSDKIISRLQDELPRILNDHPVLFVYLHGSLARGQVTPLSDVDLALVTEQILPPLNRLDLELDIETALSEIGIPRADVRVINQAPLSVRGRVVTEGRLLYCRDEKSRVDFEAGTRSRYFDLLPVLHGQLRTYVQTTLTDLRARGLYGD